MCTYKHICITNWELVEGNYAYQLEKILNKNVDYIIFREKNMDKHVYEGLLTLLFENTVLTENKDKFIIHTHVDVAKRNGFQKIHLTFEDFIHLPEDVKQDFAMIGVSTHSIQEAIEAYKLGANYITASHIFHTDCKKGVEPRGLTYLEEVCKAVPIPVFALGGIHPNNEESCIKAGAAGVCMMSEYMKM